MDAVRAGKLFTMLPFPLCPNDGLHSRENLLANTTGRCGTEEGFNHPAVDTEQPVKEKMLLFKGIEHLQGV